jgi:dCMP deaminase
MSVAMMVGTLGTCPRAAVGALVTKEGRCVSWGYNGAPPGLPHCEHELDEPCTRATHAEANALAFAARQGISTEGGTLYVSVSPCAQCARLLIAAGIRRVVYHEPYRDSEGLEILDQAGVRCFVVR